jgi:hypothetical protein
MKNGGGGMRFASVVRKSSVVTSTKNGEVSVAFLVKATLLLRSLDHTQSKSIHFIKFRIEQPLAF